MGLPVEELRNRGYLQTTNVRLVCTHNPSQDMQRTVRALPISAHRQIKDRYSIHRSTRWPASPVSSQFIALLPCQSKRSTHPEGEYRMRCSELSDRPDVLVQPFSLPQGLRRKIRGWTINDIPRLMRVMRWRVGIITHAATFSRTSHGYAMID